jgi:hypothetical protein
VKYYSFLASHSCGGVILPTEKKFHYPIFVMGKLPND